jgi:hypothetical protein
MEWSRREEGGRVLYKLWREDSPPLPPEPEAAAILPGSS